MRRKLAGALHTHVRVSNPSFLLLFWFVCIITRRRWDQSIFINIKNRKKHAIPLYRPRDLDRPIKNENNYPRPEQRKSCCAFSIRRGKLKTKAVTMMKNCANWSFFSDERRWAHILMLLIYSVVLFHSQTTDLCVNWYRAPGNLTNNQPMHSRGINNRTCE